MEYANQETKGINQVLKAGAQLYTVRDHTRTPQEVAKTLHRVAEIGYRAVQVSAFGPIEPREVARLAQQEGLDIVATHFGWDEFRNNLGQLIAVHQLWGCRHAAIGSLPKDYYRAGGGARFAAELAPIADRLAAAGIDFSYHNHSHELVRYGATTWLHQVYEAAPPQHLKAELDVYWLAAGGADPAQWIRRPRSAPADHSLQGHGGAAGSYAALRPGRRRQSQLAAYRGGLPRRGSGVGAGGAGPDLRRRPIRGAGGEPALSARDGDRVTQATAAIDHLVYGVPELSVGIVTDGRAARRRCLPRWPP